MPESGDPAENLSQRQRVQVRFLEDAFKQITGEMPQVIGASRTDAGVHARGQVANFKTDSAIPVERIQGALNALLPRDIAIAAAEEVPEDFNARFSARSKLYHYTIWNQRVRPVLDREFCWHVRWPIGAGAAARGVGVPARSARLRRVPVRQRAVRDDRAGHRAGGLGVERPAADVRRRGERVPLQHGARAGRERCWKSGAGKSRSRNSAASSNPANARRPAAPRPRAACASCASATTRPRRSAHRDLDAFKMVDRLVDRAALRGAQDAFLARFPAARRNLDRRLEMPQPRRLVQLVVGHVHAQPGRVNLHVRAVRDDQHADARGQRRREQSPSASSRGPCRPSRRGTSTFSVWFPDFASKSMSPLNCTFTLPQRASSLEFYSPPRHEDTKNENVQDGRLRNSSFPINLYVLEARASSGLNCGNACG